MNLPQVYTCSPSWTPFPPPSPSHPSGLSQCTSPKHPVSCIKPGLAIHLTYDIIHVSMLFSQIIPPSPSPTESVRLFYISVSLLLSRIQGYRYHLSKFHIYVLVYSSTLAWKIPWTEEPGGLQSMGSRRVRHDWATSLSLFTFMHWRRKWQPTSVFLPGESQGRQSLWAAVYGVAQSRTRLTQLSSITVLVFFFLAYFTLYNRLQFHPPY